MLLQNNTDDVIYIFAGIGVPARGALSVDYDMQAAATSSPLIAEYVKSRALEFVDGEPAEGPAAPVKTASKV